MTITIAKLSATTNFEACPDHNIAPGLKCVALKITMDGAYAGTGEACDVSSIFPNHCYGMCPIGDTDGWALGYEPASTAGSASGLMLCKWPTTAGHAAAVAATGANLTGVVGRFLAFGN